MISDTYHDELFGGDEGDYIVPDTIKGSINDEFLDYFIHYINCVFQHDVMKKIPDGTAYGIDFLSGTAGFEEAFKNTCHTLNRQDLWDYYDTLNWWQGDLFGGWLSDEALDYYNNRRYANG